MKPLHSLRRIAAEKVAEIVLSMGDSELFGENVGTTDDMSKVHNEIIARILA